MRLINWRALAYSFGLGITATVSTLLALWISYQFHLSISTTWYPRIIRWEAGLVFSSAVIVNLLMFFLMYYYLADRRVKERPRSRFHFPLMLTIGATAINRQIAALQTIDFLNNHMRARLSWVRNPSSALISTILALIAIIGLLWFILVLVGVRIEINDNADEQSR